VPINGRWWRKSTRRGLRRTVAPERDFESLRSKFGKLASVKKKTGNRSCPPNIRRAKHLARAIQGTCAAMVLERESEREDYVGGSCTGSSDRSLVPSRASTPRDDGGGSRVISDGHEDEGLRLVVGVRAKKLKTAVSGAGKGKQDHESQLLKHVGAMKDFIGYISKSLIEPNAGTAPPSSHFNKEDIVELARSEVAESIQATNSMLSQVHSMLSSLVSRSGHAASGRVEEATVPGEGERAYSSGPSA